MQNINKQIGASIFFILLFLLLLGFFGTFAIQVGPAYWSAYRAQRALNTIASSIDVNMAKSDPSKFKSECVRLIAANLRINGVNDIDAETLTFKKEEDGVRVGLKYNLTKPLFYNIETLVKFDQSALVIIK